MSTQPSSAHDLQHSPVMEYRDFSEVMLEVRDVATFDLARYAHQYTRRYLDQLQPEPEGVYIVGRLNPVMVFSLSRYYTLSQYQQHPGQPDIHTYHDFLMAREPVVDPHGRVICPDVPRLKNYFRDHCSFHYSAIHMALICAWRTLQSLHRDARPLTDLASHILDEATWVQPDMLSEVDAYEDFSNIGIRQALLEFVGRDTFAVYTVHLDNTTLRILKGNDFRVIEYYRQLFADHEAKRFEQLGY